MPVKVRVPAPLQKLTGNKVELEATAGNITELIADLDTQYPGIKNRLCDDKGELRRYLNVYVNEKDIRFEKGPGTPLKDGDEISIIPAIAGGL